MNYYTCFPICPFCLEPSINNNYLIPNELDSNSFICSNCGNHFKILLKLKNEEDYSFPLFSEIKLNMIEKSYVDWIINEEITGKYFITWPWDTVKFIPIFLSEYLLNNDDDKIVVLYKKLDANKITDLNYHIVLNHVYYMGNNSKDLNKILDIEDVFIENLQGFCKIFINTLDNDIIENYLRIKSDLKNISFITDDLSYYEKSIFNCGFVDENKNCFKDFIKNLKKLFGEDSIRNVGGFDEFNEINEKGIFDLHFFTKNDYNKNLNINKNFCNAFDICYKNQFELLSCFSNINYCFIDSEKELNRISNECRLFFINQDIFSKNIKEFIYDINPKWIISPWISELLAKSRYNKLFRTEVFSLLGSNNNLLLFSTDLNRRNEYKIGKPGNFLKSLNIIPHTWDYKDILDIIREEDENYITLFSSDCNNIHGENYSLKFTFHECNELKLMDDCLKIFEEIFSGNPQVIKFIKELIRTPLFIKGNYKKLFQHDNRNLEYLLAIIFNRSVEKGKFIENTLNELYGWSEKNKNHLLNSIINFIYDNNLNEEEFAIVVHHFDYNKLKTILSEIIPDNNILVTKWNNLNKEIKNTSINKVIATEFPTKTYDLFDSPLDEIIILGSPQTIKDFKFFRNSRFTEKGTKPIYLLAENENAPSLLKDLLSQIEVDYENIEEFNEEINKINYESWSNNQKYELSTLIKKGKSSILVLNENGEAMFLPFKDIYVLTDSGIKPIYLSSNHNNYVKLKGTDILINKYELYDSFGRHFFQFVINNDEDQLISDGKYVWEGFKDLIENMFEWVNLLNKIVSIEYSKGENKNKNLIKKNLEVNLKKLGVYAQSENYIKNYWLDEPIPLKTNKGEILIYEIEHPMYGTDLYKIYEWILENYVEFEISSLDAYKSFAAADYLQSIRPKFFNNTISENDDLRDLCDKFQEYISDKINESNLFKVIEVKQVKLKKDVESYVIFKEYDEYIK